MWSSHMRHSVRAVLWAALFAPACNGSDLPNDPVVALFCDEGYILNPEGTGCIPRQSLMVQGIVRDAVTGVFVEDALVRIYPPGATLETDANGYFALSGAPTTDNVIAVYSHEGYT